MKDTTSRRQRSTWGWSAPTWLTPRTASCQRSCSSHSAIDTLNFCCTRALIDRMTLRQPELEPQHPDDHDEPLPYAERSADCAPLFEGARRRATCSTSYGSMMS